MTVNQVAFATVTALGVATIGAGVAAATAATTVATVGYAALTTLGAALSIASMTAWADEKSVDCSTYCQKFKEHAGYAIAGTVQFVGQSMMQAIVQGLVDGVSKALSRKIGGPDYVVQYR